MNWNDNEIISKQISCSREQKAKNKIEQPISTNFYFKIDNWWNLNKENSFYFQI